MAWERMFHDGHDDYLERFKVPGGWLYRSTQFNRNADDEIKSATESMVFVPDPGAVLLRGLVQMEAGRNASARGERT